jgi:REP element-mobilizing transposase RayT
MANTYTQIYIHVILAVESRQNLIVPEHNEELQKYVTGIITEQRHKQIAINNMPDHLHALIEMRPDATLSDLVMPDVNRICTSHIEKQNYTLRMHCRRFTRLTNAFSKNLENFEAAIAMNFCYHNFVKTHGAIRMTPAQAAGLSRFKSQKT